MDQAQQAQHDSLTAGKMLSALFCIIIGIVMLMSKDEAISYLAIESNLERATGKIGHLDSHKHGVDIRVSYIFAATSGDKIKGDSKILKSDDNSYIQGDDVSIVYSSWFPAFNEEVTAHGQNQGNVYIFLFSLLGIIISGFHFIRCSLIQLQIKQKSDLQQYQNS
ncbi:MULTISPECIES: hypothetical protein [unclassified Agarivorans]|uniref:hypothetical protein n=1 Tax=unclassified Agarivorans TaxID=2636026 RepID=UPI0026E11812|nr:MULTISPECIES: hypothetical protein [unclassified Agarivorans]MDO6686827.1 hypothetical protein [Agarivorans sp. 3_MG-2023]MDO6716624.1 hypothetical protein [Agarivorans sp. 2_MG-2023]